VEPIELSQFPAQLQGGGVIVEPEERNGEGPLTWRSGDVALRKRHKPIRGKRLTMRSEFATGGNQHGELASNGQSQWGCRSRMEQRRIVDQARRRQRHVDETGLLN
jgi:hypothetical protein